MSSIVIQPLNWHFLPYSIRRPTEVAHPTNKVFPSTLSTRLLTLDMKS